MPALPQRPDLDQLRRRARELLRATHAGDAAAAARFDALSLRPTLTAAQLVVARDHGFASWTALKRHVEGRTGPPRLLTLRRIGSLAEQDAVVDVLGAEYGRTSFHSDRRMASLRATFGDQRALRLVAHQGGDVAGGALAVAAVRHRACGVRLIAVVPNARGIGLGRRLIETLEMEAMAVDAGWINYGGVEAETRGFYERLGFRGRGRVLSKGLPLPGRVRDLRLKRLREAAGDLDAGVELVPDGATGKLPPLRWVP